jgi:hypothetical protein
MILPTQLSEDALAILRLFIQSDARSTGDRQSAEAIESGSKRPAAGIETGLAELERHGLIERSGSAERGATLTDSGEAFFARFYHSCHTKSV